MHEGDASQDIHRRLVASAELLQQVAVTNASRVAGVAALLVEALGAGGKVLFCGNGGSAADSQHLAGEFANALDRRRPRPALAALALTADSTLLTAAANDLGFAEVFARQVEALGRPGDVLVALTTSGASPNVLRALERGRELGLRTVVFMGSNGGSAARLADLSVEVPSADTQHIQEAHLALGHALCAVVERAIFG